MQNIKLLTSLHEIASQTVTRSTSPVGSVWSRVPFRLSVSRCSLSMHVFLGMYLGWYRVKPASEKAIFHLQLDTTPRSIRLKDLERSKSNVGEIEIDFYRKWNTSLE